MSGSLPGPWICDRVRPLQPDRPRCHKIWGRGKPIGGRSLSRDCEDEALRDLMVQYQESSLEAFRELYAQLAPDPSAVRALSHARQRRG
jgi:hypothetical protein